eukprot:CAMPEP_0176370794 /NCGR_PEP_ID=MMETSP0126-20121128/24252_1 /TAXON_ID=141414 ORGANISM="Strombidinopsis acuminatum, Strain SPMC142" /NCGR_SAMPLE_ID=MMETSP0126 /ASSEMBLY_ACC=CAM_ASM_000229 /LENGTH=53 /DNA_ID=CAMNT_0017730003 /DNA_START=416 /DNA_END=577 /DNA_ORIENTATION=+
MIEESGSQYQEIIVEETEEEEVDQDEYEEVMIEETEEEEVDEAVVQNNQQTII